MDAAADANARLWARRDPDRDQAIEKQRRVVQQKSEQLDQIDLGIHQAEEQIHTLAQAPEARQLQTVTRRYNQVEERSRLVFGGQLLSLAACFGGILLSMHTRCGSYLWLSGGGALGTILLKIPETNAKLKRESLQRDKDNLTRQLGDAPRRLANLQASIIELQFRRPFSHSELLEQQKMLSEMEAAPPAPVSLPVPDPNARISMQPRVVRLGSVEVPRKA